MPKGIRLTTQQAAKVVQAIRDGYTYDDIAEAYRCAPSTVGAYAKSAGLARGRGRQPGRQQPVKPLVDPDIDLPPMPALDDDPSALAWMADALCTQVDPETWFPEKGGTPDPAKRICAECPVRHTCLEYALARPELDGVWGGTTYKQRQQMRRRSA